MRSCVRVAFVNVAVVAFAFCCAVSTGVDARAQTAVSVTVVPKPVSVEAIEGKVFLASCCSTADDVLTWDVDEGGKAAAEALEGIIKRLPGEDGSVICDCMEPAKPSVKIVTGGSYEKYGDEGYSLNVPGSKGALIYIESARPAGAFYAVQTLRQLIRADGTLPYVKVFDSPRFEWRGLMVDVARHFQTKEEIMKMIDVMAAYKMNRLHLHLTDDQGWRIEIKKYPALTQVGGKRPKSKTADLFIGPTGPAHEGFYTQDDIRAILAHAAENFVMVVPEIEMPGHSQAALASAPGLACTDQQFKVLTHWGVNKEIYCAGNDGTIKFLEDVLDEVAALFPAPYIHAGGDEVPKDRWRACPKCQARIKSLGLKDESELQSWFMKHFEDYIGGKGKRLIGWDEILEGGLPPRAVVMSWRGVQGGIDAARQGHDVIMSPTSNCYFDYRQAPEGEPNGIGGLITLEKVYTYEPVPEGLDAAAAKHVLGTQGNLWSEYIDTPEHLEYMAFPRALALAEVGWSTREGRSFDDFISRLKSQWAVLDSFGVKYRKPKPGEPGGGE